MSLPVFKDPNKNLMDLQSTWGSVLNPVIQLPINKGIILENVELAVGSNSINHRLSRNLQGWYIVRQRSAASIYDNQDNNQYQNLTLTLISSAAVSVNIFVF